MKASDILGGNVKDLPRNDKKPPKKETLALYREILKFTREFEWVDEFGNSWVEKLRKSARDEIEVAKDERDPVLLS